MNQITDISQLNPDGIYSYADYLTWQFEQMVELIRGRWVKMSAPSRRHQEISWRLSGIFYNLLKGVPCAAFSAPFDVRLIDSKKNNANENVLTVVLPDICIICDPNKLDEKGCIGSPDLRACLKIVLRQ